MKKWFVHVCSDITSAWKKPFESYPQEGANLSKKPGRPSNKGRAEAEAANKTRPPFFGGRA